MAVTLLSLGMPMVLMGDEVRRTQHGNNNAYCHDDASVWFDWTLLDRHADVLRFVRLMVERRLQRDLGPEQRRLSLDQLLRRAKWSWHGVALGAPDWRDCSHSLALTIEAEGEGLVFHWILNAYWEPLVFALPPRVSGWRRWIDTGLESPDDIVEWSAATPFEGAVYRAEARSVVVLVSWPET